MPPSALPACYKPQVISVSASGGVATSDLSSGSGSTPQPTTSSLESQDGHMPELLEPSGAEGAVGVEKAEEGECVRLGFAVMGLVHYLAMTQCPKYPGFEYSCKLFWNTPYILDVFFKQMDLMAGVGV